VVVLTGVELISLHSFSGALRNGGGAQRGVVFRALSSFVCLVVEQAGAAVLFFGDLWGLYVVGVGMMASFLFMVSGAWLLLVGVDAPERSPLPDERKKVKVQKRLVTHYATKSADAADENQRRVEAVFAELAAAKPDKVSYLVLRLADNSFVHVSFHDHGDDEVNPISSTPSFAHFQKDHADRREGPVDQQTAELVGSYITKVD